MPAIIRLYNRFVGTAALLQPAVLLIVRLWIAHVFLSSGLVKISDFGNTVDLFTQEYKVPIIPPYIAAVLSTTFELSCPVLLTAGFATRLATLPLLGMTAVIQFTYDSNIQHFYWALLLFVLFTIGAGKWSVDALLTKKYGGK